MSAKLMSLIDVHEKEDDMIDNLSANRRDLLIAPLLAAMPAALLGGRADASPVDPAMTFTKLPEQITWEKARNRPPKTVEQGRCSGANRPSPGSIIISSNGIRDI